MSALRARFMVIRYQLLDPNPGTAQATYPITNNLIQ